MESCEWCSSTSTVTWPPVHLCPQHHRDYGLVVSALRLTAPQPADSGGEQAKRQVFTGRQHQDWIPAFLLSNL